MLATALLVTLQGCAEQIHGYASDGPGSVSFRPCVSDVKNRFLLKADGGVEVVVRAGVDGPPALGRESLALTLSVELYVPDGATVQLLSPVLRLKSPDWEDVKTLIVQEIIAYSRPPAWYPATSVLPGSTSQRGFGAEPAVFALRFNDRTHPPWETFVRAVGSFTVTLPEMTVNGAPYHIGPLYFKAYRGQRRFTPDCFP